MDAITPAILLLDLPAQALGGMDLLSFTTAPKFQGIKNLPPGLHFVFVGLTSTLSVRHGVWISVIASNNNSPELFIRKWNTSSEELVLESDVSKVLKHRANLGSIWRDHLTPYRQSASKDAVSEEESNRWVQLTDCISDSLLNRILSPNPVSWTLTSSSSAKQDLDDIPGLSSTSVISKEGQLHLLPIDLKQTWREGATGRERTEAAQDRSWLLSDLTSRYCSDDSSGILQILGELQFCFVMVLTLNNYSCLEQWRRILTVIFTCSSAVTNYPTFFTRTLATLKLQLQHGQDVETGLFDLNDDGATFLKSLLSRFKKNLDRLPGNAHQDVLDELDDLLSYVQETLGWQMQQGAFARSGLLSLEDGEEVEMDSTLYDEDDEEGEYAPTVVELTREQMEALGLSAEDVARVMGGDVTGKKTPKTPNLRDRLRREDEEEEGKVSAFEVKSDGESENDEDEEEEETMDLEDMDSRY